MLAGVRSCFLSFLFFAFVVTACSPVQGQVNGVPASVTSLGFGGSNNPAPGVRASVTSLGPNGLVNSQAMFGNCCFFMPANQNPSLFSGQRHHHRKSNPDGGAGVIEPIYIPYAVPYAVESDDDSVDDGSSEVDSRGNDSRSIDSRRNGSSAGSSSDINYVHNYVHAPGNRDVEALTQRADNGDSGPRVSAATKSAGHSVSGNLTVENPASGNSDGADSAVETREPVATQPSTILIFKDGHQSDVFNYAIVGDTLFDFSGGRTKKILLADLDLLATHKANDDLGVDFQIPGNNAR
jgi:hypothetical protein